MWGWAAQLSGTRPCSRSPEVTKELREQVGKGSQGENVRGTQKCVHCCLQRYSRMCQCKQHIVGAFDSMTAPVLVENLGVLTRLFKMRLAALGLGYQHHDYDGVHIVPISSSTIPSSQPKTGLLKTAVSYKPSASGPTMNGPVEPRKNSSNPPSATSARRVKGLPWGKQT